MREKWKTGGEPLSVFFEMPVIQDFSNYHELQKKPENASRAAF